jgi:lysozyme
MRISPVGLAIIKKHEGLRLKAYLCPAGVWTIGYGTTGPNIKPGMKITKEEAERLLADGLATYEQGVLAACSPRRPNQAQFDAMVSLCYNIGVANFKKSSVVRQFKAGNDEEAALAFNMWVKARAPSSVSANGGPKKVTLPGLVRRRAEESNLFLMTPNPRTQKRRQGNNVTVEVPEGSVVPSAPKPLSQSREIIGGGVAGAGAIGQIINGITVEDAQGASDKLKSIQEQPTPFMEKNHIPEIISFLVLGIAIFIIWKRFADRKKGIR